MLLAAPSDPVIAGEASDDPYVLAEKAVEANPALKAIQAQIGALGRQAEAAVRWSDPVFSVEYSNVPWDSWALDRTPMSGVQLRLQQTFPFPGKNDLRREVAEGATEEKRWELREKENQLRDLVRRTYWNLALVRELRKIGERHIGLVGQLLATVQAKYQVGKVEQHNLLSLEVLKKKLEDDLGDYDQKERELEAALLAALHLEGPARVGTPEILPVADISQTSAALLETAERNRPLLEQLRSRAAWMRTAAREAAIERWPDLTLWAGYRVRAPAGADPGTDFFSVGLAVPLPFDLTGRARNMQEAHLASASAADEALVAARDEIRSSVEVSLAAWRRASEKARRYEREIIPEGDRTLKATLAAYQTDRADFAMLFQAELQLLQFERDAKVARAATQIELSKLEAAIGAALRAQER